MVINESFLNNLIHNMDNGRDLESYCKYEKLNLFEIRRKSNEDSKGQRVALLKRCSVLINKVFH